MAVIYDNTEAVTGGTANPQTLTAFTLGDGSGNDRMVIVIVSIEDQSTGTTCTCTFDGVSMTAVESIEHQNGDYNYIYSFVILDADLPASSGDYNVVASFSGEPRHVGIAASSFTGCEQTTVLTDGNNTQNNVISSSITISANTDDFVLGTCGMGQNPGTTTADSPQTQRYTYTAMTNTGGFAGSTVSGGDHDGTVGLSWNTSVNRAVQYAVVIPSLISGAFTPSMMIF